MEKSACAGSDGKCGSPISPWVSPSFSCTWRLNSQAVSLGSMNAYACLGVTHGCTVITYACKDNLKGRCKGPFCSQRYWDLCVSTNPQGWADTTFEIFNRFLTNSNPFKYYLEVTFVLNLRHLLRHWALFQLPGTVHLTWNHIKAFHRITSPQCKYFILQCWKMKKRSRLQLIFLPFHC